MSRREAATGLHHFPSLFTEGASLPPTHLWRCTSRNRTASRGRRVCRSGVQRAPPRRARSGGGDACSAGWKLWGGPLSVPAPDSFRCSGRSCSGGRKPAVLAAALAAVRWQRPVLLLRRQPCLVVLGVFGRGSRWQVGSGVELPGLWSAQSSDLRSALVLVRTVLSGRRGMAWASLRGRRCRLLLRIRAAGWLGRRRCCSVGRRDRLWGGRW